MTARIKEPIDVNAIRLENLYLAFEDITLCKDEAAHIVGGVTTLEKLVAAGKIRAEKRTNAQNGKWWCNAADVARHCKNMRK